ncbi:MAG: ABC transporter ATP-binding protein [Planctomycetota bacterium]|jgi:ABC-type lipoprotein export system ATPase subunit
MNKPLLRATSLSKNYKMGRADVHVLCDATLTAEAGEFVAITGASGSGKSTLMHILGALDRPDSGDVQFKGESVFQMGASQRRRYCNLDVGFVFQFYHLLPELTALENVLISRMVTHTAGQWLGTRREAKRAAAEIIDRVGLSHRLTHRPRELSGGERQRIAIARALANNPALLLADEPTGNLDAAIGSEILDLLGGLNEQGQTIVMVTHDPKVASRAHRRTQLEDGAILEGPTGTVQRPQTQSAAEELAS